MVITRTIKSFFERRAAQQKARDFVRYLKAEKKLPVEAAYIFGSYAKGTQRKWSDVDVCVVSPRFEEANIDPISFLWQSRRNQDMDNQIEPVGFGPAEFAHEAAYPLIREIKRYGVRIA